MSEDRTMTIVSICVEPRDQLVLSGAHDNIYVFRRRSGDVEVIEVSQFPFQLGLVGEVPAEMVSEARFTLLPGDTLYAITDGVTEAASSGDYRKGIFDEDRLVQYIKRAASSPLESIREGLLAELDRFTGGVYHDDITFVIARRQEAA
jgi:serine phosphatase RsbU (regulator of sigma subunit)